MKMVRLNKYFIAAILFFGLATVFFTVALMSGIGEFVTAALVISGMVCAMTGIFVLTFSRGEPFDAQLVGLLPAQGNINLCHIASDRGIAGNAYFLPRHNTGKNRVMQFNPTFGYEGGQVSAESSFPGTGPEGLVTIPSGDPLIQILRTKNALSFEENEQDVTLVLREVIEDIFELASPVSAQRDSSRFTITMKGYRLIDGCRLIAQQSPNCCVRYPCPVGSLCGALIAEATNQVVMLEQCSVSTSKRDIRMTYSILLPPPS